MATNAPIAPAVSRTIAPIAEAEQRDAGQEGHGAEHGPQHAGVGQGHPGPVAGQDGRPVKNAAKTATSIGTPVTTARTPALAHSTGSRFGTAAKVERITRSSSRR